jgi:hypothetical protein
MMPGRGGAGYGKARSRGTISGITTYSRLRSDLNANPL